MNTNKLVAFKGRIILLGLGVIGQGVIPLILRHIDFDKSKLTIISPEINKKLIDDFKLNEPIIKELTPDNYLKILDPLLSKGDLLLNLSVNVSSHDLIQFCHKKEVLYLDTCIEPWPGRYDNLEISPADRSNYSLREEVIALKKEYQHGTTALVAHGANPGLVSHFVKQALLNIANDSNIEFKEPDTQKEWSQLAHRLGIKVIHIAERDTQIAKKSKENGVFVNTWSVDGFLSEGLQPAELGWGTHEKELPHEGFQHKYGCNAAIYLNRPGASLRVRSWTPKEGPYHGFLITHNEAISIPHYFSLYNDEGTVIYRPTVHYAYHPCDAAVLSLHEFAGKNWNTPKNKKILMDEIESGADELGVLLMGAEKGAYWYGSTLTIDEARKLVPYNNATSLQVTSSVLAGLIWIIENPQRGIVEAEDLDYKRILEITKPYLGTVEGYYTNWTPLEGRQKLFEEKIDQVDPWQFKNFQVV